MPKRKFTEFRDLPRTLNAKDPQSYQYDRINGILDHSKTALFQALKLARGFERQKLGRRQKTATAEKELDHIRRLKLEICELKALDLAKIAESHLHKSLLKIKSISACDGLPERVRVPLKQDRGNDSVECRNVQARLFNSEVVQKATDVAIEGIRAALGIAKLEGGRKRRLRAKDYAEGQLSPDYGEHSAKTELVSPEAQVEADEDQWEGISSSTAQSSRSPHSESIYDKDIISIESDDYKRYENRLAASSDSSSLNSDSEPLKQDTSHSKHHLEQQHSNQAPSLSLSLSPSLLPCLSPSPPPHLQGLAMPTNPPRPNVTGSTTFLPTLLTTGYYSGSDSDARATLSDDDSERRAHSSKPRKNRMGQQARRTLWEKKYKDRANHLRNEDGRGPRTKTGRKDVKRDAGWDARKGAVGDKEGQMRGRGKRGDGRISDKARIQKPTGANLDPVSNVRSRNLKNANSGPYESIKKRADAPLHPSWEAARRAKEAKRVAKPMGKKVVF